MATVNLSDFDIEVENFSLTFSYPGRSGSWYEPAEPPVKEYRITSLAIVDLNSFDAEDIEDVYGLEVGDDVILNFVWTEGEDDIEFDNTVQIESLKISDDRDTVILAINARCEWEGNTPLQSLSR